MWPLENLRLHRWLAFVAPICTGSTGLESKASLGDWYYFLLPSERTSLQVDWLDQGHQLRATEVNSQYERPMIPAGQSTS